MAKLGRNLILTDELIEEIYNYRLSGMSIKDSCLLSGIGNTTYDTWLKRAKNEDDLPIFKEFAEKMELARIQYKKHHVDLVNVSAKDGNFQASKFILATQFPDEYAEKRHDKVELGIQDTSKIKAMFEDEILEDEILEDEEVMGD